MQEVGLIQKESFTREQRHKIVNVVGGIIGDYLENMEQLENISDEIEIMIYS